jgi:hypothetical protein
MGKVNILLSLHQIIMITLDSKPIIDSLIQQYGTISNIEIVHKYDTTIASFNKDGIVSKARLYKKTWQPLDRLN